MKSVVDHLYETVSRMLKVPSGSLDPNGESVIRAFRPAPRYAGYRLCRWVFTQLGIFIPFALFLLPRELHGILDPMGFGWILDLNDQTRWQEDIPAPLVLPLNIISVGGYLIQLVFSFVFTLLSAKSQHYLLTDHSLRIRRGLWVHQQITLSLKNIQQVKFSQNLLQRLWGIGSLEVRTAGGGAPAKKKQKDEDKTHTGELEGLLEPIELRELLNQAIKEASAVKRPVKTPVAQASVVTSTESPALGQAVGELLLASQTLREAIEAKQGGGR